MDFPALITADLHVTHRNLDLFDIFSSQVMGLRNKFKSFIVVGDLFDSQDVTKWTAILRVYDFFDSLDIDPNNVILLSGTHDAVFYGQNVSTLRVLDRLAVVIVSRVVTRKAVWVPHSTDLAADNLFIEQNYKGAIACFSHHMIQGLRLNNYLIPTGLKSQLLQKFKFAFNGHIHQPQVDGNIISLGSPWQHSFAEANQKKFLWLWNDQTIEAIPSNVPSQYIIGTLEELKDMDLQNKCVRVILGKDDDVNVVAKSLEVAGAKRWEFQQPKNTAQLSPERSAYVTSFDELMDRFATTKEITEDDAELGKLFLEKL